MQAGTTLDRDLLGAWLLTRPLGGAVLLTGADMAALRGALADAEPPGDGRIGLVIPVPSVHPAAAIPLAVAEALAAALQAAFPGWYDGESLCGIGTALLDEALVEARLADLHHRLPALFPSWARQAVARQRAGLSPRVPGMPLAIELEQMALALAPGGLTIALALPGVPTAAEAPAIMHGMEWLARSAKAAVTGVLPEAGVALPEALQRLPLVALRQPPPLAEPAIGPDLPWAGPIQGRPHWASAAEQRLAAAIGTDAALRGRFGFNQAVATRRGSRPRVDLLWEAGRLVVEIDGYADHGTREAFRRDRQRDYELLVSGYAVLRLTAEEVLADLPLVLDKLRDAVRVRGGNQPREAT